MIERGITTEIENFFTGFHNLALLITGAPETGKTTAVREYGRRAFRCFVEIDLNDETVLGTLNGFSNTHDLLTRISSLVDIPFLEGETLIFFDSVESFPDIITAVKFLVDDGRYRYILAGTLSDIEIRAISSIPVGYLAWMNMYPLSLLEFFSASGVSDGDLAEVKYAYDNLTPVESSLHSRLLGLFRLYLRVGGMPGAVQRYIETNDLSRVRDEQMRILEKYREIFQKNERRGMNRICQIYNLIPSELERPARRFIVTSLGKGIKAGRCQPCFSWFESTGITIPVHYVEKPILPLEAEKKPGLFKLFPSDVGLLSADYDSSSSALCETAVAGELLSHGLNLFCYNSRKNGEIDFVLRINTSVLPVIVRSGKENKRHSALKNIMKNEEYDIGRGVVLTDDNMKVRGRVVFLPVYMAAFIRNDECGTLIYKVDLSGLE